MKGKAAAAILVNGQNKILFQLRDNKPYIPYPNFWGPLGGAIEQDESVEEALIREVKEEIGYEISDPVFIGTFDDHAGKTVYVFRAEINKKIKDINLTEGQEIEYFDFDELLTMKIPSPVRDFLINNKDKILE